jgi:hypothetical protein
MTKKRQIESIIVRILSEYGFDAESAKKVAGRLAGEIYNLVPARIVSDKRPSSEMPPEIQTFQSITGYYPASAAWDEVAELARGKDLVQMREAYRAWCIKGNNPRSAIWLKWIKDESAQRNVTVKL